MSEPVAHGRTETKTLASMHAEAAISLATTWAAQYKPWLPLQR